MLDGGDQLSRGLSALRSLRKEALSEGSPFMDCPKREAPDGLLQYGYIIGDQQKAQGKHPQSQEREDGEDPTKDENNSRRNPDPSRIGMAEAAKDAGDLARHLMLQASERPPQNGSSAFLSHALCNIHRREEFRESLGGEARMPSGSAFLVYGY
jgi:hypothetical protein